MEDGGVDEVTGSGVLGERGGDHVGAMEQEG